MSIKWRPIGYLCTNEKELAILLPSYCGNCKKNKKLEEVREFETFEVKEILFKDKRDGILDRK